MKLLLLITILCPIALIYFIPKYLKLREKYISLEENSVSLKKYQDLERELSQLKKQLPKKEDKETRDYAATHLNYTLQK